MTADPDVRLLRKLIAQGGIKYTAGIDRQKYERLVEFGWLTAVRLNADDVLYEVTEKGSQESDSSAIG